MLKIDTFYENSRNFQNSKIFGEALSKSPIFGHNKKNDVLYLAILTFDEPRAAGSGLKLVKIFFLKGSRNLKMPIFRKLELKISCLRSKIMLSTVIIWV